jgi:glycosyltransferase involved in cell wall biosynthesis
MPRAPRILYAAGPGDVIGTYKHWKAGRDDPSQVAITYSGQFYEFCRENQARGYVISSNARVDVYAEDNLIIKHRPIPFLRGPGPLYHLGQIWYGLRLVLSAVWYRVDLAIVADGAHWFVLGLMPWFGVKVVPTLHCVLWPTHRQTGGRVIRLIRKLNARFFRRRVTAVLSLSNDITKQVQSMLNGKPVPIIPFLPTYRPESFGDGFGPPPAPPPFRVFFAGRIEKNKGVFDLLDIARNLADEESPATEIEFDLCGDGSQLETLRAAAANAGVSETFRCHGHSTKPFMREQYEKCHVVIVPTTSEFVEGFNKVVAEGVLAGRPVITSSVCPALEYVQQAVLEVPPDNAQGYQDAIVKLRADPELYESKRLGCAEVRTQFYNPALGWKSAVAKAVGIAEAK